MDIRSIVAISSGLGPSGAVGEGESSSGVGSAAPWIFLGVLLMAGVGYYLYASDPIRRPASASRSSESGKRWSVLLSADGPKGFDPYEVAWDYNEAGAWSEFRRVWGDQADTPPGDGWRGIESVGIQLLGPSGNVIESKTIPAPKKARRQRAHS